MRAFLLIALFALSAQAEIVIDPDLSLITIEDCETGLPIEGISGSTDAIYAGQKVEAIEPKPDPGQSDQFCGSRSFTWTRTNTDTPPVDPPVEPTGEMIVYTRVPRAQTIPDDARDRLPETGRMYTTFNAFGQLVLREGESETVIYDCAGLPCTPFDQSVSPDGQKIAFTVYRASGVDDGRYLSRSGDESQIHIYDIPTQTLTAWPHTPGEHQTSPAFFPNGEELIYSTNIDGYHEPGIKGKTPSSDPMPHLYRASIDGSNRVAISPHTVSGALHPILLKNSHLAGRWVFSEFWLSWNLPYVYDNGRNQGFATLPNMWMLMSMDLNGGDDTALLGAHKVRFNQDGQLMSQKSLHFVTELPNGDICVANYYRANNFGLGDVFCFTPEAKGIEGSSPQYIPQNIYSVANWSVSTDVVAQRGNGKIGFPEGDGEGNLILSVGDGLCSTVQLTNQHSKDPERKGCDVGLYRTTVIPSQDRSDLEVIVDSPDWHEFGARVVASWSVEVPESQTTGDGSCQIASSNAWASDSYPEDPYEFNNWNFESANNGSRLPFVPQEEVAAIRFYEVVQNTSRKPSAKAVVGGVIGNPVRLLGDAPLLADKSFKAELPCDTPFLMAGVDSEGRVTLRDQRPQSLRPGELRTCEGCHLHGEPGRPYEDSMAFTADAVELLTSTPIPTFADVQPILEAKFAACGVPTNYEDLVWDSKQQALPEERRLVTNPGKSGTRPWWLERPQLSLFVDSLYARRSLLYWMAEGERTDGMTDAQYDGDIDFEGWCDAGATDSEKALIRSWIDAGSPEG